MTLSMLETPAVTNYSNYSLPTTKQQPKASQTESKKSKKIKKKNVKEKKKN